MDLVDLYLFIVLQKTEKTAGLDGSSRYLRIRCHESLAGIERPFNAERMFDP